VFLFLRHFTRPSTIGSYRSRVSYRRSNHYNIIYLYTAVGHTNTHTPVVMEWEKNQLSTSAHIIDSAIHPSVIRVSATSVFCGFFFRYQHCITIHSSIARVPISVVRAHTLKLVRIFLGGIIFLKSIRFASEGVLHATSSGGGAHLHFEIEIETQRIMAFWQRGKRLRVDSFQAAFAGDDAPPHRTWEEGWARFGTAMVLMRGCEGRKRKDKHTTLHITSYVRQPL